MHARGKTGNALLWGGLTTAGSTLCPQERHQIKIAGIARTRLRLRGKISRCRKAGLQSKFS